MRIAAALGAGVVALVASAAVRPAPPSLRILYASDWNGSTQIFAADPTGRTLARQVTFARPEPCLSPAACGYTDPLPSPDGRRLVYSSVGPDFATRHIWLARADGTGARELAGPGPAAWAPDSRRLAYTAADGIHVLELGGRDRVVDSHGASSLRFSPDGKSLGFLRGGLYLLRNGRERLLVPNLFWSFDWSPDGRRIAYASRSGIGIVDVATRRTRIVYPFDANSFNLIPLELAWSPDGRNLAFFLSGIRLLDTSTLRTRKLTDDLAHSLSWAPDGKTLLYAEGAIDPSGDAISTGDVKTVTPVGRVRTIVSASKPYGGQIVAAAWVAGTAAYRSPENVDGVFAGGPVRELAADGSRLAWISCGIAFGATAPNGPAVPVSPPSTSCVGPTSRRQIYSLGLAGDRVAWWDKGYGLCFYWYAHVTTIGVGTRDFGGGTGCLGSPPYGGTGTPVGAAGLLVRSSWQGRTMDGVFTVDRQTIERLDADGGTVPIASTPGPYTPLDVDGGRIVASGTNETRILDDAGNVLLSVPLPTLAAQLDGSTLVLGVGAELRVYDVTSGALEATRPLPATAGHDCAYVGDPTCGVSPPLALGGLARGYAAYSYLGNVHLLRLADGADQLVGPGTQPRFGDAGLYYADGARIRALPFSSF